LPAVAEIDRYSRFSNSEQLSAREDNRQKDDDDGEHFLVVTDDWEDIRGKWVLGKDSKNCLFEKMLRKF
jgi:hypothetical protein